MRHPRLYIDAELGNVPQIVLDDDRAHYLLRVLRLGPGDELTVFDGRGGERAARIVHATRRQATVELGEHRDEERESPLAVRLIQGVSRGERMDFAIQKATELGACEVLPAFCAYGVVKLAPDQQAKKHAHWQAVAVSACEQSRRNRVPAVHEPRPLEEILAQLAAEPQTDELRLVLEPSGGITLHTLARTLRVILLIGPEGGLHETELEQAQRTGFRRLRLGPRVLRTETAAAAALAALQALWGDLG